jgi:GTPase SAR1 family protein
MGTCYGAQASGLKHLMLAGIEGCGKTFFLYSRLKQFITLSSKVRTKPTDSFNYEVVEFGSFSVAIWDLPGRENLRIFWPNFYRNIEFSGLIYLIDYEDKDTLNECNMID